MDRILAGVARFQQEVRNSRTEEFAALAAGQSPQALMITCSDSRIDPNLMTQTAPGELFVIRNAGNMVPPPGHTSGEGGTIEFAVAVLKVPHIIVCGHSHCGAMKGALDPDSVSSLPSLRDWVALAAETASQARSEAPNDGELLACATQRNVLNQLENLRAYPAVREAEEAGQLTLHGWVYELETGLIDAYAPSANAFVPLSPTTEAAK